MEKNATLSLFLSIILFKKILGFFSLSLSLSHFLVIIVCFLLFSVLTDIITFFLSLVFSLSSILGLFLSTPLVFLL